MKWFGFVLFLRTKVSQEPQAGRCPAEDSTPQTCVTSEENPELLVLLV